MKTLQLLLLMLILMNLNSCKDNSDSNLILPSDLVGKYCRIGDSFYIVEILNSDTLFLREPHSANFKFIISGDQLIIPQQIVEHIRYSSGGIQYTISEQCQGFGSFNSINKSITFNVNYADIPIDLIMHLNNYEYIPLTGLYKSDISSGDSLTIHRDPASDSLLVDLYFEKNIYEDSGFSFKAFQSSCSITGKIDISESAYIIFQMEFPENRVEYAMSKWIRDDDLSWVIQYSYAFNGNYVN